jgi:hypothetical protein
MFVVTSGANQARELERISRSLGWNTLAVHVVPPTFQSERSAGQLADFVAQVIALASIDLATTMDDR